jgi:hypothetical protein
MRRALLGVFMLGLLAAACWQSAARHLGLPTLHASSVLPESFWARGDLHKKLSMSAASAAVRRNAYGPTVYPYSVIPGGIHDANELREAAARDYVVARHYAKFDYSHARLVRVNQARAVYLSYRIRDRVFWTHKQIMLQAGELLLTDGKVAARTRCGNQVSELPQEETSPEEPAAEVFDQPVGGAPAPAALPFRSALTPPALPGADPLPPNPPGLFANGFMFPYVGYGVPLPSGCESKQQGDTGNTAAAGKQKPCDHHHKPPVVPEPSTYLLISTGFAAIFWQYWRSRRPASN